MAACDQAAVPAQYRVGTDHQAHPPQHVPWQPVQQSREDADRPAPETYSPSFVNHNEPGLTGWNLRLARERHRTGPGHRPSPCTAATSSPRRMASSTEVSDAVIADK